MKRYICHMLNGTSEEVYAYKFIEQDGDAAIFVSDDNSDYILYGVKSVEEG